MVGLHLEDISIKNMNLYKQNNFHDGKMLSRCAAPDTEIVHRDSRALAPTHCSSKVHAGQVRRYATGTSFSHPADHKRLKHA